MPDWVKRVRQERVGDLLPGEEVAAASYFQGRGSAIGQITFGAVSNLGGAVVGNAVANQKALQARQKAMEAAAAGQSIPADSIASRIPTDKGVIAVSDQRVIVFGYKQGVLKTKIEDVVATIDLPELAGWAYSPGKIASVLHLAFDDGSNIQIELPRANKPDQFATTLGIPTNA